MSHGCGLSGWRPFREVIRAESRAGPQGPYTWAPRLFPTFRHNFPTIWSPAENKYLVHFIGIGWKTPDTCKSTNSVASSLDLRPWSKPTPLLVNVTNSAAWPLWTPENPSKEMPLKVEKNNIYRAENFNGPYELVSEPAFTETNPSLRSEDPFLWRDKRGHWHFLVHHMVDIALGLKGPRVGAHVYARNWKGPWHYNITLAYNTTVESTDGNTTTYYRRERPKLYFSEDGDMTRLYLLNGVQEFNSSASYTLIQAIRNAWKEYEESLGGLKL